ncbi:MAG: inositol monophosphatase family protein, partial [Actinomycetota bacterium]
MDELALARELADIADEIAMTYFATNPAVTRKPDGSPLTEADGGIERALRARIAEVFPDHGTFGEEAGLQGDPGGPLWVIDP